MRTTPKRVLRWIVAAPAAVWSLYVVVANAFFLFGGLGMVVNSTEDVKLTYGVAWTLWPGSIHANNVRVLGQDHNVQWALEVDEAQVTIRLTDLVSKRFHATQVRGQGASFRFRHRVSPDSLGDPLTALLPPISGHDPPLLKPSPPPSDPNALWTVHLENVDVSVRELWFQQFRYVGSGRARGAFRLRPALHLWVGPASLDLDPASISVGGARVIDAISGHIDCVVHPFDTRVPVGRQVFRFVTTSIRLDGKGVTLEPLAPFLPPGTHLTSRGGTLGVAVRADRGVFTKQSRVTFESDHVELERAEWRARGERMLAEMRGLPDAQGRLELSVKGGSFGERGAPDPALEIGRSSARVKSSSADSSLEWQIANVEFDTERASAPDLRRFNRMLAESGFKFSRGAVIGSVRAQAVDEIANGSAILQVTQATANRGGFELSFDGKSAVDFSNLDRLRGSGNVALTLDGNRLVVSRGAGVLGASKPQIVAHGEILEGRGSGEIRLKADRLAAKLGKARLSSRARLDLRIQTRGATREIGEFAASGELDDVRAAVGRSQRAHVKNASLRTRLTTRENHLPDGFLDVVARELLATDESDLRELRRASIDRVAMHSELGPDAGGRRRLAVDATLDDARALWGDLKASASARAAADIDERVLLGKVGAAFVDLHLESDKLLAQRGAASLSSRARLDARIQTRGGARELKELAASGVLENVQVAVGPTLRAHAESAKLRTQLIPMPVRGIEKNRPPDGFLDVVARDVSVMEVSELRACRWAAIDELALHGALGFDPNGRRRLAVNAALDNASARWDDLRASATTRINVDIDGRVLEGEVGPVVLGLDATKVVLQSGGGRPKGWHAEIPEVELDALLSGKPDELAGQVALSAKRLDGRLGDTPIHADVLANGAVTRFDPAKREIIGTLNLAIDHAGLESNSVVVKDWWARARLSSIRVTADKNLDIWGNFRGKLRDGQPLLALFSDTGVVPNWLPGALPLADLDVNGDIHRACQLTDLEFASMSGGPLVGAARIQSDPDGVRAAMIFHLADFSPISVGLAVSEGKTHVSAFASDGWLAEQYVTLDQLGGKTLIGRCTKPTLKCDGP